MDNIVNCPKCKVSLIQEELETHECYIGKPQKFWFDTDDDFIEFFDGINWIPHKIQQPIGNMEKTTEDETEPE
jgi:hypothetical protein